MLPFLLLRTTILMCYYHLLVITERNRPIEATHVETFFLKQFFKNLMTISLVAVHVPCSSIRAIDSVGEIEIIH